MVHMLCVLTDLSAINWDFFFSGQPVNSWRSGRAWLQLVVVLNSLSGTCFWDHQGVCCWKDEGCGNAGETGNSAVLSWKM